MALNQDKQVKDLTEQTVVNDSDYILLQDGGTLETKYVNSDTLRDYITGLAWLGWAPTWVGLTVGNATVNASYMKIGKTVHLRLSLIFGSSTAITAAYPTFSLPFTAKADANNYYIMEARYLDNGNAWYFGDATVVSTSPAVAVLAVKNASGTILLEGGVTSSSPFAWGTLDRIVLSGTYEAA